MGGPITNGPFIAFCMPVTEELHVFDVLEVEESDSRSSSSVILRERHSITGSVELTEAFDFLTLMGFPSFMNHGVAGGGINELRTHGA